MKNLDIFKPCNFDELANFLMDGTLENLVNIRLKPYSCIILYSSKHITQYLSLKFKNYKDPLKSLSI